MHLSSVGGPLKKRELLGIIVGIFLIALGLYLTAFVHTRFEWRPSEKLDDIGVYSTPAFSEKLSEAGRRFQGLYLLYAWGPEEEHPYVNYSSSPRLRIYDQIENLVLSLVFQPGKRIYLNVSLPEPGYYTFIFEDVQLRPHCLMILKGYTNEKVYPYHQWWPFSIGLSLLGILISLVSLRRHVPMHMRFQKKNSRTPASQT